MRYTAADSLCFSCPFLTLFVTEIAFVIYKNICSRMWIIYRSFDSVKQLFVLFFFLCAAKIGHFWAWVGEGREPDDPEPERIHYAAAPNRYRVCRHRRKTGPVKKHRENLLPQERFDGNQWKDLSAMRQARRSDARKKDKEILLRPLQIEILGFPYR